MCVCGGGGGEGAEVSEPTAESLICVDRSVELGDLVPLNHAPVAAGVRVLRHRLEHEGGATVREVPVDDVEVASDPAEFAIERLVGRNSFCIGPQLCGNGSQSPKRRSRQWVVDSNPQADIEKAPPYGTSHRSMLTKVHCCLQVALAPLCETVNSL